MPNDNALLAIAALLGGAAYLFADEPASAQGDGGASVSNGFGINNPLNIRYIGGAKAFNGEIANHGGYGQYSSLQLGVRAGGLQLTAYYNRGLTTITQIISTWAPSKENNTAAYIADVSQRMGVAANEPLAWPQDEVALIQAMAYHENGYNPMTDSDVAGYIGEA